jgi:hypothetical protein
MTLQDMIHWIGLHTTEGVAQKLLDQQKELNAYREKFTLHEYDKKTNCIVFKTNTTAGEVDRTGKYERVQAPIEKQSTIPVPEDWRLMTLSNALKTITHRLTGKK